MKKMLMLILVCFVSVSIFTVVFTIQMSSTFEEFEGEDEEEDNGNDSYDLLLSEIFEICNHIRDFYKKSLKIHNTLTIRNIIIMKKI